MRIFSGFDGMSCGQNALLRSELVEENKYTYLSSETDKWAKAVTQYNYPNTIQVGDITKLNGDTIKDIDLMIGGSPCQDVSFSGKGKGLIEGERSNLFFKWVELLNKIKPKYFLLENVRMKQEYLDIISSELGVKPILVQASLVSAQKRDRYYWCNWDFDMPKDRDIKLKDILECGCVDRDKSYCVDANYFKGGSLKMYFEKKRRQLVFDSECFQVGVADLNGHDILKRVYDREGKAPTLNSMNGGNREPKVLCDKPIRSANIVGRRLNEKGVRKDGQLELPLVQTLEVNGEDKSRCLSTVQKDTLITNLPKGRYPNAYNEDVRWRKLSVKECERLQTLSDDYTMFGDFDETLNSTDDDYFIKEISNSQRYKMLGNAWCVEVVVEIFKGLKNVK